MFVILLDVESYSECKERVQTTQKRIHTYILYLSNIKRTVTAGGLGRRPCETGWGSFASSCSPQLEIAEVLKGHLGPFLTHPESPAHLGVLDSLGNIALGYEQQTLPSWRLKKKQKKKKGKVSKEEQAAFLAELRQAA